MKIHKHAKKQALHSWKMRKTIKYISDTWDNCAEAVSYSLMFQRLAAVKHLTDTSSERQQMFEAHGKQITQAMTTR